MVKLWADGSGIWPSNWIESAGRKIINRIEIEIKWNEESWEEEEEAAAATH